MSVENGQMKGLLSLPAETVSNNMNLSLTGVSNLVHEKVSHLNDGQSLPVWKEIK